MSRLRELIDELCPDGVEYKKLGEVIKPEFGVRITKKNDSGTLYPVYGGGGESFRTDAFNRENRIVVSRFAMSEACVRYVSGRFWLLDSGLTYAVVDGISDSGYVGHWLFANQMHIFACTSQSAQRNLITDKFLSLRIPIPPIEVQREIVRILDSFQELDDALTAEIEAREKQQQNAIDSLIGLDENTAGEGMVPLGTLCQSIFDGDHQPPPQSQNGIPFIVIANFNNGVIDFTDTKFVSEDYYEAIKPARKPERGDIILSVTGSYGISALVDTDRPFCFQRHVAILKPRCDSQFLLALMRSGYAQRYFDMNVTGAVQKQISLTTLRKMPVPDFDEERQADIAKKAFEMDRLVELLRSERDARRKQFEHYRDKLLSFPEKEA